jgi:serine/threonine-protein kinase RsbW
VSEGLAFCGRADPPGEVGPGPVLTFDERFAATPDQVRKGLMRAMARVRRARPDHDPGTLEIVLAEVLNNVAEHAYAGGPAGAVELGLSLSGGTVDCTVCDRGAPLPRHLLDPPAVAAEGPDASPADAGLPVIADELPEGGFGWQLIHALAENLRYARREGCNHLAFSVTLGPGQRG